MATNHVRRPRNPVLSVAIALVVIAAGCAAWFGWRWYSAAHSSSLSSARVRDQALQQGEQAVENFNTMNYRNVAAGLKLWEKSSTGELLRAISTGQAQFISEVHKDKTDTTAASSTVAVVSVSGLPVT